MGTYSGPSYVAEFDASRLIGSVTRGAERGVAMAAAYLQREYKLILNKPGPLPRPRGAKSGGRRIGQVYKGQDVSVSAPGEPPHYRTRMLLQSISLWKLGAALWAIGTHLLYGLWLEMGTPQMDARPYLRPGLNANLDRISDLILTSAKEGG